jgi:hypothetical protein
MIHLAGQAGPDLTLPSWGGAGGLTASAFGRKVQIILN